MMSPGEKYQARLDVRLRTLRILWLAFISTAILFTVFIFVVPGGNIDAESQRIVFFVLLAVSFSAVAASYVIKRVYFARSIEQRKLDLVQTGLIIALALCEGAIIMGLLSHFITGHRLSFVMFIIGAVGEVLHFPQRAHLEDAAYGHRIGSSA